MTKGMNACILEDVGHFQQLFVHCISVFIVLYYNVVKLRLCFKMNTLYNYYYSALYAVRSHISVLKVRFLLISVSINL
jgi:hypothetical protein